MQTIRIHSRMEKRQELHSDTKASSASNRKSIDNLLIYLSRCHKIITHKIVWKCANKSHMSPKICPKQQNNNKRMRASERALVVQHEQVHMKKSIILNIVCQTVDYHMILCYRKPDFFSWLPTLVRLVVVSLLFFWFFLSFCCYCCCFFRVLQLYFFPIHYIFTPYWVNQELEQFNRFFNSM